MASLVNQDGNVVSGTVNTDEDARALASYLDGPRRDSYYDSGRSLSREDEEVHEVYERLYDIVNNPENYTANQINDAIVEITEEDGSPVQKYGRFDGNYNADLADHDSNVYKYWRNYRSHKKRWDAKRDKMIAKKKQELDAAGMKITDEMTDQEKREMAEKRRPLLREVRKKYDRGMLGQQIYYLLEKAEEIQRQKEDESDSDSSDDGASTAAMSKPSPAELKRREEQRKKEEARMKRMRPLLARMKLGRLPKKSVKEERKERRARMAAAQQKKEDGKPSVKVMFGDEWIGPIESRSTGKQYWTRRRDNLSVYVSSNGELTLGKIRATEAAKAKAEAKKTAKKASTGGGRTRKKRGKGKQKKRKPPKSKKNRNPTEERVAKAIKAAKNKQRDRIVGLRQPALVVPDDDLVHSDDFAAGIFDPNAPESDEFSSGIGLTHQEENEGVASAAAVDDGGIGWGQFSSEGFNGGRRKTRKMKGGHHLYKRLGVSKYASQKQIKKAYNKLKKKKKLTQKVKYAYKILSKKKSRKKYNAKYKKHKKHKKSKKRRKGGLPHAIVEGKVFPSGYTPEGEVSNPQPFREPTWIRQL